MATKNPTVLRQGENAVLFTWTLLTNDDGAPMGAEWTDYCDRSVHISGTFDSATVVIQGSNLLVPATYVTLTDPQGNIISKTAEAIEQIVENTLYMRPNSSGGGASEAVVVSLLARRNILVR